MKDPMELKLTTLRLSQIISSFEKSFISKRRKGARETTMFAQTSSTRGRTQGGGDAQPRNVQEPCVYFLKGQCKKGTRCRYRHIQPPNKNSDKRVFTSNKKPRRPQGNFQASNQQAGHRRQAGRQPLTCYSCGKTRTLQERLQVKQKRFCKHGIRSSSAGG